MTSARTSSRFDAKTVANEIERELRRVGTPARAAAEKRYLKSDLSFVGATVGDVRRVVSATLRTNPHWSEREILGLAKALWREPIHERRMGAVVLLESRASMLREKDVELLERLLRGAETWALVDGIAANVVGDIASREPGTYRTLGRWARDGDFWIRRAALLALMIPLRRGAPFARFTRLASPMLDEKEFFIRKALGWVLRETSKQRPDEVYEWLSANTSAISGVTMREATKHLTAAQRTRLGRAPRRPANP